LKKFGLGWETNRLSKLLFYIAKQNQPIDLKILAIKILQKALDKVPLPLVHLINKNYRRIINLSVLRKERIFKIFGFQVSAEGRK
jgi:hypothetical protein